MNKVLLTSAVKEFLKLNSNSSIGLVSGHWSKSSNTPSSSVSFWDKAHPFSSTSKPSGVLGHSSSVSLIPSPSWSDNKFNVAVLSPKTSATLNRKIISSSLDVLLGINSAE